MLTGSQNPFPGGNPDNMAPRGSYNSRANLIVGAGYLTPLLKFKVEGDEDPYGRAPSTIYETFVVGG